MKKDIEKKNLFKHFIQRIIEAENKDDAIQNVLYGTIWTEEEGITRYGVETAFEHEKLTVKEMETLFRLVEKMA